MRDVPALDSTGLHALRDVVRRSRRAGTSVFIAELPAQPRSTLFGSAAIDDIGADNVVDSIDGALVRARALYP